MNGRVYEKHFPSVRPLETAPLYAPPAQIGTAQNWKEVIRFSRSDHHRMGIGAGK
jgi:hypothetical protein